MRCSALGGATGVPKNDKGNSLLSPSNNINGFSSCCFFLLNCEYDTPGVMMASGPRVTDS